MSKTKNLLSLAYVTLKNFRAYAGKIDFDLSLEQKKTIHIIHGEMGLGKTTLLNAIYWCLYGNDRSKKSETSEGIINTNALDKLAINDTDETYVEIFLRDDERIRYKIKRKIEFIKKSESAASNLNRDVGGYVPEGIDIAHSVVYHYLKPMANSEDWEKLNNAGEVQAQIGKIFPQALSSYFLFDAELLNDFFYQDSDQHVKDGIETISGIPILDDAMQHLKSATRKIKQQTADEQISTKPIAAQMKQIEQARHYCKTEIEKIRKELLPSVQSDIQQIEQYLRQHDDQEIQSIQDRISVNKELLCNIKKDRDDNDDNLKDLLRESLTRFLLRDAMLSSRKKFQEWEREGKIPLAITKIALDNIFHSNPPTCICGTVAESGTPQREKLDKLRQNVIESSLIQNINTGRSILSDIITDTDAEKLYSQLQVMQKNRNEFDHRYGAIESELNTLSKRFQDHEIAEVQEKAKEKHDLGIKEEKLTEQLNTLEFRKKVAEERLEELDEELKKIMIITTEHKFNLDKVNIANKLSKTLDDVKSELIDELRNSTAELTTKYFLSLVSKKDDFAKVEIKPNYKMMALDHSGKPKTLSAGQSCCLALSYIAAIRDIAQRNYFMMIDSPFHNISQEERVDIATNLPSFLPDTQIILLVQDQEYTGTAKRQITGAQIPSVRETLQKNGNIGKEYILVTDKKDGEATNTMVKSISPGGSS